MGSNNSKEPGNIAEEMLKAFLSLIAMGMIFFCKVVEFIFNRTAWLLEKLLDNGKHK